MEDLLISLEPIFQRVERFVLWHNRYISFVAFLVAHCLIYAVARAELRPLCAIALVLFVFHLLDCLRRKRSSDEQTNLSELTQFVLRCYRHLCQTQDRVKYLLIFLLFAYVGIKLNGVYVSHLAMLIIFTFPAMVYHQLGRKLLKRLAPIFEQLDQSMEFKRRTLVDREDLLVKVQTPGLNHADDEEKS